MTGGPEVDRVRRVQVRSGDSLVLYFFNTMGSHEMALSKEVLISVLKSTLTAMW